MSTWPVITYTWKPRRPGPFDVIPRDRRSYRGVRGRVFKVGGTWHYEVLVNGVVVNADNTDHWRTIFDGCNEAVFAFETVIATGQKVKPWDELA